MNNSITEVELVPTLKEVTEIDLIDSPNPQFKTKTIIGKTVPKSGKKKGLKELMLRRSLRLAKQGTDTPNLKFKTKSFKKELMRRRSLRQAKQGTDTPNLKFETKTIIGQTVPKTDKMALKKAPVKQGKIFAYYRRAAARLSYKELRYVFEQYGAVVTIVRPTATYCFVTFEEEEPAKKLLKMGTVMVSGHELIIEKVKGRGCGIRGRGRGRFRGGQSGAYDGGRGGYGNGAPAAPAPRSDQFYQQFQDFSLIENIFQIQ